MRQTLVIAFWAPLGAAALDISCCAGGCCVLSGMCSTRSWEARIEGGVRAPLINTIRLLPVLVLTCCTSGGRRVSRSWGARTGGGCASPRATRPSLTACAAATTSRCRSLYVPRPSPLLLPE